MPIPTPPPVITQAELKEWVTMIGAAIAALTATWNLVLQLRRKKDRFFLRFDSISPSIEEEAFLSVVSISEHKIKLVDWGFVEPNGSFSSFYMGFASGALQGEEIVSRGDRELAGYGAHFEAGYRRRKKPIGIFAMSVTQRRPVVMFSSDAPLYRKLWIRLRLVAQPHYLAWQHHSKSDL